MLETSDLTANTAKYIFDKITGQKNSLNKAKYILGAMKLEHVKRRNSKIAAQVKLISPPSSKAYAYLR